MAKSKHNITGNGSHRQRVLKFQTAQIAAAKLVTELEVKHINLGQGSNEPSKFEVLPEVIEMTIPHE